MIVSIMNLKDVKVSSCGPIWGKPLAYAWKNWEKPWKTWVSCWPRLRYEFLAWIYLTTLLSSLIKISFYTSLPSVCVYIHCNNGIPLLWLPSSFCLWDFVTKKYNDLMVLCTCYMAIPFDFSLFNVTFKHLKLLVFNFLQSCISFCYVNRFSTEDSQTHLFYVWCFRNLKCQVHVLHKTRFFGRDAQISGAWLPRWLIFYGCT